MGTGEIDQNNVKQAEQAGARGPALASPRAFSSNAQPRI